MVVISDVLEEERSVPVVIGSVILLPGFIIGEIFVRDVVFGT